MSQSHIGSALLKDGRSNFSLEIIEYCQKTKLLKREQFYLDQLELEYNILKIAYSLLGFKHSQETIKK
jgi:group I intron endonuclease